MSCFCLLTAKNLCVYVFVWTYLFISLGYIPKSGISGYIVNSVFSLLRNCQTVTQNIWKHFYIPISNVVRVPVTEVFNAPGTVVGAGETEAL